MANVTEIPVYDFANTSSEMEIKVAFAGKNGSGKTTLINNIFGVENKISHSPHPLTEVTVAYRKELNGVTLKVLDLACQESDSHVELPEIENKIDLLIYCLPAGPGSKFSDGNPAIMKSIQQAYGSDIWKHCILVFTYSDLALYNVFIGASSISPAIGFYKEYLQDCAATFKDELVNLGVQSVEVTTIFHDPLRRVGRSTIVAIPAGRQDSNIIYPDVALRDRKLERQCWLGILLREMENSCKEECREALKLYRAKFKDEALSPPIEESLLVVGGCAAVGGALGASLALQLQDMKPEHIILFAWFGTVLGGGVSAFCLFKDNLTFLRDRMWGLA